MASNNSKTPKNPASKTESKRRGRPPGAKDTKPRKKKPKAETAAKAVKKNPKLLKPDIESEPIFPRDGEKGVLPGLPAGGNRRNKPRPLPPTLATSNADLKDVAQTIPEDIFTGSPPEVSNHADWRAATPIERRFCYEYFASGFRLVDSFRTIAGDLGNGTPDEVLRRAKMYANRGPVVKAMKVLVDYFLQDRKLVYAPKILSVLEAQAFYDPAEIINDEGDLLKPLSQLDPHLRWCIKGIETKFFGKDADRSATIVVLVDRTVALDKLARYIALFSGEGQTTINVQNNVQNTTNVTHVLPEESRARLRDIFNGAAHLRVKPPVEAEVAAEPSTE